MSKSGLTFLSGENENYIKFETARYFTLKSRQNWFCLEKKNCEILDPLNRPPGIPMRPKGGLAHSGDLNQYYIPQQILKQLLCSNSM